MGSFLGFTVVAIIAHVLVWMWRPWLPGVTGYAELIESGRTASHAVLSYFG